MNFGEIKAKLVDYSVGLADVSTRAGDYINMALHKLERFYNWRYMEKFDTGTLTSASDNINEPTNYKKTEAFLINVDNEDRELIKKRYRDLLIIYKDGSNIKDVPNAFSLIKNSSDLNKIYFRPWPDDTYTYIHIYHKYSTDLSADADTNWWTTNKWEALVWGALVISASILKEEPEELAKWKALFDDCINDLIGVETREELDGSTRRQLSGFPQVS